jgi:hypothetical protein
VNVVQKELPFAERGEQAIDFGSIKARSCRSCRALKSIEHPSLVPFGLQPAQHPRARVRQRLVIEIDGVLRGHDHAQSKGARLFQQCEQRRFRWRVGHRRQKSKNLVEVHERTQARGAALAAHPPDDFVEQQRDEEHPLLVVEMRDRDHAHAWTPVQAIQQAIDVERFALEPGAKAWRRQQMV